MSASKVNTEELSKFGRIFSLMFNRSIMYQVDHPYVKQSFEEFYPVVEKLLVSISPLVFSMNREQFFVDEEPLDPRVNVSRLVDHCKKSGVQSISFYKGLTKSELTSFLEIFVNLKRYPDAGAMKKALAGKSIDNLKINHVFFKKVSADDEVISRDIYEEITPILGDKDQRLSKKLFVDMVLESVLEEEFEKSLSIKNLMNDPNGLSVNMVHTDTTYVREHGSEDLSPGALLLHQMQMLAKEVEENISKGADINLSELAEAVFEMKRQLLKNIEAQRAKEIIYANEEDIVGEANELTDNVLIQLIKDEYKAGKISASRLAQILRRLIPEVDELKRILPKVKEALLEEGMSSVEYFDLIRELGSELQSDELAKVLQESAEQVGIESKELVEEIKEYPLDAAKLICLAAEIRKGTGDEQALTDLLVEYAERVGTKVSLDIAQKSGTEDEEHLRQVITRLDSEVVSRLRRMDVDGNALRRLEEKLASRVDAILEKARKEWLGYRENLSEEDTYKNLSVLEMLEQSVSEKEELAEILKVVRSKIQSDGIDENDFGLIYSEIAKETQKRREEEAKEKMPLGILKAQGLMYIIKKEIARAKRYNLPFSLISFSAVKAKLGKGAPVGTIKEQDLMDAILQRLSEVLRDSDIIGQLRKNVLVALLPQTMQNEARLALRRCLKALHAEPITINGVPLSVKITGTAIGFDGEEISDVNELLKTLWARLGEMALRVKNIQQFM